ncbi:hypothetical protein [Holdemanella porci]|uniref:hypothetical protein n=1 Tax=Holdemanella porci TaxID=2652276 RepID=UPI00294246F2|nr:hypothetical protein [Holdemanella porci]
MNAREMFEEQRYKRNEENEEIIYLQRFGSGYFRITFDLSKEEIAIDTNMENVIESDLLQAIIKQAKELGWLEEEQKQETNLEHYFEYLSTIKMCDFALIDGRVTQCSGTGCSECDFNGDCIEGKFRWLKQPYKKLPYKLSQFEFDLLNAYKNSGMRQCISNYGTLLEMYGKGHFKGIDTSTPIHEILDNCKVV